MIEIVILKHKNSNDYFHKSVDTKGGALKGSRDLQHQWNTLDEGFLKEDSLLSCFNSESNGPSENRISVFLFLIGKAGHSSCCVIRKSNMQHLITVICCHIRYEVSSFHDEEHVSSIISCLSCLETKTDYRNRLVWHGLYDKLNWAISENTRILSGVVKMESDTDLKKICS